MTAVLKLGLSEYVFIDEDMQYLQGLQSLSLLVFNGEILPPASLLCPLFTSQIRVRKGFLSLGHDGYRVGVLHGSISYPIEYFLPF